MALILTWQEVNTNRLSLISEILLYPVHISDSTKKKSMSFNSVIKDLICLHVNYQAVSKRDHTPSLRLKKATSCFILKDFVSSPLK